MRAAAILGLGCSAKHLTPFQDDTTIEWRIGIPESSDQADAILLFGGDGTINRHLGRLVKLGVPVLVVPAGSGNDFAHALRLSRTVDSLAAWRKFRATRTNVWAIDLGTLSALSPTESAVHSAVSGTRYFGCVAGVGLDAEVARRANELPRWLRSHGGYALSLVPAAFGFAPMRMKIWAPPTTTEVATHEVPGRASSDRPTILAAFANTSTYGRGMKIAPGAKLDDGLLDVCVVGGMNLFELFCMFPTVYSGRHLRIKQVEYFQASRLRVETESPLDVYADGEYICRTPVEVGVARAALRVVTP
jgi:diacylglycerol kinase (ATP)